MYCLETDFLVDLLRKNPAAHAKLEKLVQTTEPLSVTPISASELFKGAFKSGRTEEVLKVEDGLFPFRLLEFDLPAARMAGELLSSLAKKGQHIGDMDTLTAAICLRHNKILITKNKKHFQKISGIKIQDW